MTRAHKDRINKDGLDCGYSIRVGKNLPEGSANLAYVHSPEISPESNLMITDLSGKIKENGLPTTYKKEKMVFPDDNFLLRELSGESRMPSKNISLTDEFSIPATTQDIPSPLYYLARTKYSFDAKNTTVSTYEGGYIESPPEKILGYEELSEQEREELLYLGSKIRITYLDGSDLKKDQKYKIKLVKESGENVPENSYSIYMYTNFRNSKNDTFVIRYEKYENDGSHTSDTVEVLNADPFFDELSENKFYQLKELSENPKLNGEWREELFSKEYSVIEAEDNTYQVYAPSQVAIANNTTRPAHQFKYKVSAELKAKYSKSNPGEINIGIAYLNNSIFNVENLTGTLKTLYEDNYRPEYLDFKNPHNEQLSYIKENSRYWLVDLSMPAEHYDDYDLIIIAGYGFYDMSIHSDSIRRYVGNGGKIWVDNSGNGEEVLSFTKQDGTETFIANVGFSKTNNETGHKVGSEGEKAKELLSRLYVLENSNLKIGYEDAELGVRINPTITFGAGESLDRWNKVVDYSTTEPSIIHRKFNDMDGLNGEGEVIVSNCGIFRSLFFSKVDDENTKFVMNIILSFAESKKISTPWISEYTYHRDNLFLEEYDGTGDETYYIDGRSNQDSSQIIAKKVIKKSTRESLLPYMPSSFYKAKGEYKINVDSDNEIFIENNSLESGALDESTNESITTWTNTTSKAIPGWGLAYESGSTPEFNHVTSYSQRGSKAIEVIGATDGVGTHSYWSHKTGKLIGGQYKSTVWVKTKEVKGTESSVMPVGIYDLQGNIINNSSVILGSREWTKLEVGFNLETAKQIEIRLGFTNGNGEGTMLFDMISLHSLGSVYQTPINNGSLPLYFYAATPRGESFDLKSLGFKNSDITTYDPKINASYTIRAFVYSWSNRLGRYVREYGNYVTEKIHVRRTDGTVNLGTLTTMLPPLNDGAQWADMNKVYYEIFTGDVNELDSDSNFVNLSAYNTETGKYYFNKNGETIIRYIDIFNEGVDGKSIVVQATTGYYTIRATKRRYGLKVESEDKIKVEYPASIDNREGWFLRIKNGAFIKKELGYSELLDLKMHSSRYYEFQQRLFGTHYYSLPEYKRQTFKPKMGIKKVRKEIAEYVNDRTIRLQNAPLYIKSGEALGEELQKFDSEGKVYKTNNNGLIESEDNLIRVYVDENMDGNYVEWDGYQYDIDHNNGYIVFDTPVSGNVKADYKYNNITIFKRRYNNMKVKNKNMSQLSSSDKKVFVSKHKNWLSFPTPVVKMFPYGEKEASIVSVESYTIDYENGRVMFKEDVNDRIVVDHHYSTDKEIKIKDYDEQNGLIYLENNINFKDEVYVNYYYEENFLEYRGYYDSEEGRFIHLDLNPSEGHYSTMPTPSEDNKTNTKKSYYEEVPTSKLMNKEVYVYIKPYKNSFGLNNNHAIRHCYSLEEWKKIQKTDPTALLLAVVHSRESSSINDVTVMDARTRGGGLKEEISLNEIDNKQPLSMNNWDIGTWDGKSYYKNGVLVVEIPKRILETEGGQFTEKEVTDIVGKYIAYGIYYIIEFV
jgi:hypothetical protein